MKNAFVPNQFAFVPKRPGTSFVCEACCDQGVLQYDRETGCVIFHCEAHMTLCIKDGEVLSYQSHGVRQ